jgi:hypothetical protein
VSDTHAMVGVIRAACWSIRDHYEGSLDGPRRGGNVGGSTASEEPPLPVSVHVLDARRETHMDLAHYARVIYGEVRDINGGEIQTRISDDEQGQPLELAAFIDRWAQRLAEECPADAQRCAKELARHAAKLKALALPDRRDWMPIGDCPVTVADADGNSVPCGAEVRAYNREDDSGWTSDSTGASRRKIGRIQFIVCPGCGTEDTLAWWMSQILGNPDAKPLVTAAELISIVARDMSLILTQPQIRKWAERNQIPRAGRDSKGRVLYDHAVIVALIREGKAA